MRRFPISCRRFPCCCLHLQEQGTAHATSPNRRPSAAVPPRSSSSSRSSGILHTRTGRCTGTGHTVRSDSECLHGSVPAATGRPDYHQGPEETKARVPQGTSFPPDTYLPLSALVPQCIHLSLMSHIQSFPSTRISQRISYKKLYPCIPRIAGKLLPYCNTHTHTHTTNKKSYPAKVPITFCKCLVLSLALEEPLGHPQRVFASPYIENEHVFVSRET